MLVAIIGAGWSGCHLALELSKEGHRVLVLDRQSHIFGGTSGAFGIRLHKGPHYPRSKHTRENCQAAFGRFRETYNELVVDHEWSVYANGTVDSQGYRSKVSDSAFEEVCMESAGCKKIDNASYGFAELGCAYDLQEPSVAVGSRARSFFERELANAGVSTLLGVNVLNIKQVNTSTSHQPMSAIDVEPTHNGSSNGSPFTVYAETVVNCTGFQSFIPQEIRLLEQPLHFQFVYQVCLALKYRDNAPTSDKPVSFIVMDGWFPCLMPAITSDLNKEDASQRDYILTHGAYTILDSFSEPAKAHALLKNELNDDVVDKQIRAPSEREMKRFWPGFSERFTYEGWYGSVLAKPACPSEFRSSFCFERDGVIHVFPGKVSNVFDASDEVSILLRNARNPYPKVVENTPYKYVPGGVFDKGQAELQKKAGTEDRSTSQLHTFSATNAAIAV